MNIVVAGGSEVGLRIAERLMASHHVAFIGPHNRHYARLERLEIEIFDGSITSPTVLHAAGAAEASVFIAVSEDDEKNIVSCVAARRMGAAQVICFLNRRGFFEVDSDEDALAESLGIDAIVRPSSQLAEEIVRIVTVPGALDVRSFVGGKIILEKFEVEGDTTLTSEPLSRLKMPTGVLAAMGQRGDEFFIPRGSTQFQAGDRMTVIGTPKGIRRLHRFLSDASHRKQRNRAIIVGGGLVGGAVAEGLSDAGWYVKVIESDRGRCTEIATQLDCLVLHGDGSDLDLLEQELVDEPQALVAVTSNDEKNLLISLLAQHLGVPRVITRANRLINERIFEKVGVDVVLSAKGAAIRRVVNEFVESDNVHLADLEHGDFSVLEVALDKTFQSTAIMNLTLPGFAIIGAILRERGVRVPTGRDTIQGGDRLLVICSRDQEQEVRATFGLATAEAPAVL